jgi:ribonuclease P protein component
MLPKKRRLTTELLDEVMTSGRIFYSPILSLKAIKVKYNSSTKDKKNNLEKSRFAVVAAKKYFKTAVLRNKMRRRTYTALAATIAHIDDNFHCILMLKPSAIELDPSELKEAIHEIFVKSQIIT